MHTHNTHTHTRPHTHTHTHTHTPQAVATVELTTVYSHKALTIIDAQGQAILDWRGGDEFQLSLHGGPQPCYNLGRGFTGEWVYFGRTGSDVENFTIPGLAYGVQYARLHT